MGKEASCLCQYSCQTYQVKVVLESTELIFRGELKKRIARTSISNVAANDETLSFQADGEIISLALGEVEAARWQRALVTPPPSLAQKLGIASNTCVQIYGEIDDGDLHDALQIAAQTSKQAGNLFLARINDLPDLQTVTKLLPRLSKEGTPIWIIYPKGSGQPLSESHIRSTLRALGFIDNKIASISSKLTGLRFVAHKNP